MENVQYRLPDSAIYGSPVYIHSHAYTFYNQLSLQSAQQTQAIQQLHDIQNGVTQVLRDNINLLIRAQQAYESKGFDIDLINLNASFKELKKIKAESLIRNTISHQVSKYRKLMEDKILSLVEKWLDGKLDDISNEVVRLMEKFIGDTIQDNKYIEIDKNNNKALRTYLKTIRTWASKQGKGPEYIAKKIAEKFINSTSLEKLGLISELDKMKVQERLNNAVKRIKDITDFFKSPEVTWTTDNIKKKADELWEFTKDNVVNSNIFAKGMPGVIGGAIGNLFELEILKFFYENKDLVLKGLIGKDGVIINAPDIVPLSIQKYITTDVDLGVLLDELPKYSLGISAKTSIYGMNFKSSFSPFGDKIPKETLNLLFYILINYYALQNYEANNKHINVNFLGDNLIESILQSLFIVENAGKLLGSIFIKTDISGAEDESLQKIMMQDGRISLPILLEFPDKVVYTSELLERIFNEFQKQAQGVFNEQFKKYINADQLRKNWLDKQLIIKDHGNATDRENGMLYVKLSEGSNPWMIDTVDLSKTNWFKFAADYNKNWLEQ